MQPERHLSVQKPGRSPDANATEQFVLVRVSLTLISRLIHKDTVMIRSDRHLRLAVLLACISVPKWCGAQEELLDSRIVSVSMFKNGLAFVERQTLPKGPGSFRIAEIPDPVHGTFWFVGDANVSARIEMRDVTMQRGHTAHSLQRDLAGRTVSVFLRDTLAPVQGVVRAIVEREQPSSTTNDMARFRVDSRGSTTQFLVIDTPAGESYIDRSMIAHVSAKGPSGPIIRRKPVLIVTIPGGKNAGKPLRIRYLARGLSWAPSYLVELLDDRRLRLRQKAIVRNELEPLKNADMNLISGFPHVRFRHVTSPLSPNVRWSEFFRQLNQGGPDESAFAGNAITQQLAIPTTRRQALPIDLAAVPDGQGIDLHYQPIGRHSLGNNAAFSVPVSTGTTDYSQIVQWVVPDQRDAQGRRNHRYQRTRESGASGQDGPWDALRFRNPLPMPMTTGPAMIMSGNRFSGQTASYWVNRGEETTLPVTKSLSIRAVASENEKQGKREVVYIGGNDFQRISVEGTLIIGNHRDEQVDIVIRRRFSGDLVRADRNPNLVLREEGVYSANRRNELAWNLKLDPGQRQELSYEYNVLVDR